MFVAIVKTVKDLENPSELEKKLPSEYPLECVEGFKTREEAETSHPGREVMSCVEYHAYHKAMRLIYAAVEAQMEKPWYKFWG